jgi:hypothetical protein
MQPLSKVRIGRIDTALLRPGERGFPSRAGWSLTDSRVRGQSRGEVILIEHDAEPVRSGQEAFSVRVRPAGQD